MRTASLISAAGVVLALLLSGCVSVGEPKVVDGPFDGPALAVESGGSRHIISMTAPATGWVIAFDTSRKYYNHTDAFITITRPNPAYPSTPGDVQQKLDSTVDTHERLTVYARVRQFDQKPGPYRWAAGSSPPPRADQQLKK